MKRAVIDENNCHFYPFVQILRCKKQDKLVYYLANYHGISGIINGSASRGCLFASTSCIKGVVDYPLHIFIRQILFKLSAPTSIDTIFSMSFTKRYNDLPVLSQLIIHFRLCELIVIYCTAKVFFFFLGNPQ